MLNFTHIRALRMVSGAALTAVMLVLAPVSQAGPSQAVFAFSGAGNVTSLQVTAGGVTTIVASGRGWYDAVGPVNGSTPTNNYIVGLCGNDACNETPDSLTNNFFVFDNLAAGVPITAASLLLDVPVNSATPGFISSHPLAYTIYDVSTPVATLGTAGPGIFADLGSGTIYGSRVYSAGDMGTTTTIPLNAAAIAFLNANRGVPVAFGGSITVASTVVPVLDSWPTLMLMALAMVLIAGFGFRFRNKF